MTVLFVHSHRFAQIGDKYYSPGGLPQAVWLRYLKFFSNIVVLGRKLNNSDNTHLSLSSRENVSFELLDYLESPLAAYRFKNRLKKDIKNIIQKHNIKAVIARLPSELGYRVVDVCEELNIPFAIEVVGSAYDAIFNYRFEPWYHVGNLGVKLLAPISSYTQKKYVAKSEYSIYVTEHYLQSVYPSKTNALTAFASNVELPAFENDILKQRKEFLESTNRVIKFGMIGNLDVHYKGYDIALKALAIVKNQIPKFELHFVGGGKGKAVIKLAKKLGLEEHLVFNGKLPSGEAVFKYLDSLDIYLHPSRTEGLPRALVEAMGRACPCLASTAGGIPELLDESYLHKAEDYRTLANQILKIIQDKDKQLEAAICNFNKAKEYAIEKLEVKRNEFWAEFYENVSIQDAL